ncbi:MAG: MOSC domain-containing protein [Candidatus Vogelbacteria bacterium]|nr:MOSC domain-containing protein [Candidatus Vogelbacteria bacterium]
MPILKGIAIKKIHRGMLEILNAADITIDAGIIGDYRGAKPGKRLRQVTVISEESWNDTCDEVGQQLPWETRRVNLLISGIKFGPDNVGQKLRIGQDVILEITGETTPCGRMDESIPGLMNALRSDWRGGVTCKVIEGGTIKNGDKVSIE